MDNRTDLGLCFEPNFQCHIQYAFVAQLDRATAFEAVGRGFDSLRTHQLKVPAKPRKIKSLKSKSRLKLFKIPKLREVEGVE